MNQGILPMEKNPADYFKVGPDDLLIKDVIEGSFLKGYNHGVIKCTETIDNIINTQITDDKVRFLLTNLSESLLYLIKR